MRESYRGGKGEETHHCKSIEPQVKEIEAIKLALSHKEDISVLSALSESVEIQEGLSA
ncbi:MAG: hypothetical protein HRF42_05805 [Candidatus Brocadia sp.]